MRGATGLTVQRHQILRLPRKMTVMIDPRHKRNVIYNARSNRTHPPTSPNIAPPTKNDSPKYEENLLKTDEASFTMGDDSTMIRNRSDHSDHDPNLNRSSRTRPFGKLTFHALEAHIVLKNTTFRAPAIYPNFTECCTCHEK